MRFIIAYTLGIESHPLVMYVSGSSSGVMKGILLWKDHFSGRGICVGDGAEGGKKYLSKLISSVV